MDKILCDISDNDMIAVCRSVYKMYISYKEFMAKLKAKRMGENVEFIYSNLDELKAAFTQKLLKYAKSSKDEILKDVIDPILFSTQKHIWNSQSLEEIVSYSISPSLALQGYLRHFNLLIADFYFINENTKQRFDNIFSSVSNEILYKVCEILGNFGVDYIEHCKNQELKLKGKKRIFAKLVF
ncbi:hypothetical protein CFT12S02263_02305 [Campylobacter fetus subsp. testudinum]|nr:hypothetical protein CFT12S02263_02305 [Campylobacter fetus subsp. testudinum]